jgi:hypothetical protein
MLGDVHPSNQLDLSLIERAGLGNPIEAFFAKQGAVPSRFDERRGFARRYYRRPAILTLRQTLPAFERPGEQTLVYLCDISRSGVGFLCDRELYPEEVVDVSLPVIGARQVKVRRCRRLAMDCYVVGSVFA